MNLQNPMTIGIRLYFARIIIYPMAMHYLCWVNDAGNIKNDRWFDTNPEIPGGRAGVFASPEDFKGDRPSKGNLIMNTKPKLLIVEDEQSLLEGLQDLFTFHGYEVDSRSDGALGLEAALTNNYDCIILDVMLPSMDGFSICNEIRKRSRDLPIVMLTAKNSEEDIINGLSLGADDYISKPFSVRELVLRINAILRRTSNLKTQKSIQISPELTINPETLNGSLSGEQVFFTRRELDILLLLKQEQPRPVSRKELLTQVWGYKNGTDIDTRTVDIHMAKLRKKVEANPKNPSLIITIRGEGYLLFPSVKP